jgi:hypothetical protein
MKNTNNANSFPSSTSGMALFLGVGPVDGREPNRTVRGAGGDPP